MRNMALITAIGSLAMAHAAHAEGTTPADPAAVATAPLAIGTVLVAVMPLVPVLERIDFTTSAPRLADPFNRLNGAIRHRFASAMVDLYPATESGFHFSVGTRFFKKTNIQRDQQEATGGLLYVPRLPRGGTGQRGFRRATPAATVGYTELLMPNLMLGLEGGTLLGRVVQPLPHGARLAGLPGGRDNESGMRVNPVLNLTVAYAF